MKLYIALLRGVMPTGKNKVPMQELRNNLELAGLHDVKTYIQSGNVLLRSDKTPSQIEVLIHTVIAKKFGGDVPILVITPHQLKKIVSNNPLAVNDDSDLYFVFLKSVPSDILLDNLKQHELSPTNWVYRDKVIYMDCPQTYSKSKINNNFVEKKLDVIATTRNNNTTKRLLQLTLE